MLRILSYKGRVEINREKIERKCKDCGKVFLIDMRSFYRWLKNNRGKDPLDYACSDCSKFKSNRKHGESKTRLFNRWKQLFARTKHSKTYVQKGIKVCPEWYDFMTFKRWAMKNGFKPELHLDRKDNNGDYSPSNCQWITPSANASKAFKDRDKETIRKYEEQKRAEEAA
jgi:hypothetical protein